MPDLKISDEIKGDTNAPDRLSGSHNKTLYDASLREIFWKNFVAGLSRALGGIVIYALFTLGILTLVIQFIMPILSPLLDQFGTIFSTLERLPQF